MADGGWKAIGMSDDKPQSQWAVAGQRDDPAAPRPPVDPRDMEDHTFLGDLAHNALGAAQIAGSSIASIPAGIGNAAADFAARATGHTAGAHPFKGVQPGQAGRDFSQAASESLERGIDATGAGDAVAHGVGATDNAVRTAAANHPALANGVAATGDALALAGARALPEMRLSPFTGDATPASVTSRVVRGTTTAAGDEAQNAALAARQANYERHGFITSKSGGVGKVLAGDTAQPTAVNHNSDVFRTYASSEANVPHTSPLDYGSLEQGRAAPNAVMDRVGNALPEGHLDGPAQIRVNNAGAGITDPASQQQVANMRQAMLQPMTGAQRMQQLRQYRQEAYSRLGNEGANSTDQQAVGRAQLDMANAIEDHIGRNLPQNGDVSLQQFQDARRALAKNYTVQSALRGTNVVDPNVLARIQRADPQLLDGHMETMANFANDNREVVGLPSSFNAPGVAKDLSNVNPLKLGSLGSAVTGGAGPALGRRLMTGGSAAGRATARAATPNAGLGDEFAPLQPQPPQPPEGMTASTPERPPPAPQGPPGQIPLADLLSHGVEQSPPAGLTAGPMGSPPAEGIPFTRNAAHEAGDLSLGDMVADLHRQYGSNSDLPGVMSQGVPEGTMARTSPGRTVADTVDFPGGNERRRIVGTSRDPFEEAAAQQARADAEAASRNPNGKRPPLRQGGVDPMDEAATQQASEDSERMHQKLGDVLTNNGSGESSASVEAINRGSRDIVQVDPDGNGSPVMRGVDQVDARSPKGHLLVDRSTGEIIDRGGLNQRMAEGLRNRWASRVRLGDTFAPAR